MPLYEYQCTACGKLTEKRQKFSDPEITECPHCGGHLERTITAPAVQFKGGGWYADLYSSGKKPAAKSGDGSSASEGGSASADKTAGSSETTAATKSEAAPAASSSAGTTGAPASAPSAPSK